MHSNIRFSRQRGFNNGANSNSRVPNQGLLYPLSWYHLLWAAYFRLGAAIIVVISAAIKSYDFFILNIESLTTINFILLALAWIGGIFTIIASVLAILAIFEDPDL